MVDKDEPVKLLIKIILYLLLAIAFFSDFAIKSEINFTIMPVFIFGIISLIFLYIGDSFNKMRGLIDIGYGFVVAFIFSIGWFIFNAIFVDPKQTIPRGLLILSKSQSIYFPILIAGIVTLTITIMKLKK